LTFIYTKEAVALWLYITIMISNWLYINKIYREREREINGLPIYTDVVVLNSNDDIVLMYI
jgi:hypothetical protein